jgi:hypothetical protein
MNPVGWFEIYVSDMQRAQAFYEFVFGHKLTPLSTPLDGVAMMAFPMYTSGSVFGASGALVKHPMRGPSVEGALVYFSCADCATEAARINAAGGLVVQGKTAIGAYGFIALARDSEGNAIGLHSMQ